MTSDKQTCTPPLAGQPKATDCVLNLYDMEPGEHTVEATATDKAGNKTVETKTLWCNLERKCGFDESFKPAEPPTNGANLWIVLGILIVIVGVIFLVMRLRK